MDAQKLAQQMALCAAYELNIVNPVPVSMGRWKVLWLEYAVAEDEGAEPTETCLIVDAYLLDDEAEFLRVAIGREVEVPRGSLQVAPDAGVPFRDYLAWLVTVAGDGKTGVSDALAYAGTQSFAPLYEVALGACEDAVGKGA